MSNPLEEGVMEVSNSIPASNRSRPLARRLANQILQFITLGLWNRTSRTERRIEAIEAFLQEEQRAIREELRSEIRSGISEIEERLQALIRLQASEIERLSARVANSEQRLDRQEWGREALVDRLNHQDARDEALSLNLEDLGSRQSRIESRTEEMLGLAWDAVAMARRIAVLEDRTEALLAKLESESVVVPYPDATKLAS
ncbi:MAG: hypothetical protein SFX72_17600 [Isosphaeraceae bacterium]|nr:hypothetical protein [Isosphaeraceae bacterium]